MFHISFLLEYNHETINHQYYINIKIKFFLQIHKIKYQLY